MKPEPPIPENVKLAQEAIAKGEELYCPNCCQTYIPNIPTKEAALCVGNATDKEQWNTGICSDGCWNQYIHNNMSEDIILF